MTVVRVHHYAVEDADYDEFVKRRTAVIDAIRADHPGLSKTTLVKLEDGTYTDTWQLPTCGNSGIQRDIHN